LNKLYIRFARNARGSGAQRSDAPTALSVKLELPAASLHTAHSYLWPEGVKPLNKFNEQENIEANPQLQRARRG